MKNRLYYGDNLDVLRDHVATEAVDLIYLDPPFNSNRNYNVLFKEKSGEESPSQIEAFTDTWVWNQDAEYAYQELTTNPPAQLASMIEAMRSFIRKSDMMAYLVMMAQRLKELHRVLKPTGSIYLHCDPTASHYLKMLMDTIFGAKNYRNEIVWKRTGSHGNVSGNFGDITDTLLFYTKSQNYTWNQQYTDHPESYIESKFRSSDADGRRWQSVSLRNPSVRPNLQFPYTATNGITYYPHPNGWSCGLERLQKYDRENRLHYPAKAGGQLRLKMYLDETPGHRVQNLWDDIRPINSQAQERLGYPTQKPLALLERIIRASSNEGDVVLDPFCGCGTAVVAAQKLDRRWIGIDITHLAVSLIRTRMVDHFGKEILEDIEIVGEPKDVGAAKALFDADPFQFEWWAVSLVGAMPANDKKKGSDKGVDGIIRFHDDNSGKAKRVLVQVKGGKAQSHHVVELKGAMDRDKAELGLFVTLQPPTKNMTMEAVAAGFYGSPIGHQYPKLQIMTIEELLSGEEPKLPRTRETFQKASRIKKSERTQIRFDFDLE